MPREACGLEEGARARRPYQNTQKEKKKKHERLSTNLIAHKTLAFIANTTAHARALVVFGEGNKALPSVLVPTAIRR